MTGYLLAMDSIAVLLIAMSFMLLIVIGMLILIFTFKIWIHKQQELNEKRYHDLAEIVNKTQELFVTEVQEILSNFKKLLNNAKID